MGDKTNSMQWFWLSFCDTSRPKGEKFIGALIIQGYTFLDAVHNSHLQKLNPGGEVAGAPILEEALSHFPEDVRGRLLSKAEAERL